MHYIPGVSDKTLILSSGSCNATHSPLLTLYHVYAYYPGHIVNGSLHTTLSIEGNDNLGSQTIVDFCKV